MYDENCYCRRKSDEHTTVSGIRCHTDRAAGILPQRTAWDRITPQKLPKGVMSRPVDEDGVQGEFLYMEGNPQDTTVLYIHGGGFVVGSTKAIRPLTGNLVKTLGLNLLSINYRLAPEHQYPAAHEDCMNAYRWLLNQPFGKRLLIMGESAGGNLILGTVLHAKDDGLPLPGCVVGMAPTVQYDIDFPSYTENLKSDCIVAGISEETKADYVYCGDQEKLHDPYFAPYYGDFSGFPPTMLICSDTEFLRDDSVFLHEKLQKAGVTSRLCVFHKTMHIFPAFPVLPESKEAYRKIKDFVYEVMKI